MLPDSFECDSKFFGRSIIQGWNAACDSIVLRCHQHGFITNQKHRRQNNGVVDIEHSCKWRLNHKDKLSKFFNLRYILFVSDITEEDISFMKQTIRLAETSGKRDEVPIACVLVRKGKILVQSGNQKNSSTNPMSHAECEVIQEASRVLKNWRLEKTVLYVTTEPCLMCTGLIYAARVPKVVFGCTNPKGGSLLYIEQRRQELNLNHSVEIVSGVMEKEAATLLKNFFQSKRMT